MSPTVAWLLAVVSSEAQAETLAHQSAWADDIAAEKGWTLDRAFSGVSTGRDGPRRLLRDLIAELRNLAISDRPTWLLMIRADRVGRGRLVESQVALHEIADLGVRIWTRDAGEIKLDSATDQIIAAVKAGLATLENEVRRDKATAVFRRKRAAGLPIGNKRPYGLILGPDGKDTVVEDQAATVRLAFDLRIGGLGTHAIAQQLALGSAPYRYKKTGERAVRWASVRVRQLLRNRAYVGTVVDEVTFRRAQAAGTELARAVNAPQRRHPWPLTGAVRCYCGNHFIGQVTGRGGRFRYYTCRATWNHDGHFRLVRAEHLEREFVALLEHLAAQPALIDRYRRRTAPGSPALIDRALKEARKRLGDVNRRREHVWVLNERGDVRNEDLQERLDTLAGERDGLTARIAELEGQRAAAVAATTRDENLAELFREAVALWADASDDRRRTIARSIALTLGGLCCEEDKRLTVRRPIDPQSPARRRAL